MQTKLHSPCARERDGGHARNVIRAQMDREASGPASEHHAAGMTAITPVTQARREICGMGKITAALDFSPATEAVADYAARLAEALGADLEFVYVRQGVGADADGPLDAQEALAAGTGPNLTKLIPCPGPYQPTTPQRSPP